MRINSSQMNVDTQFPPLDELVQIISVDGRPLSQWYDGGTGLYSPNRTVSPLTLRPTVKVTDPDTNRKYTPVLVTVIWYYREGSGSETQVTNTVESQSEPYTVKSNGDLVVRRNVASGSPVTLRCAVTYRDPRTALNAQTEAAALLVANVDASARYDVNIQTAKVVEFNPLSGESSQKTITAKATYGKTDKTADIVFEWYAIDSGHASEMKIDNTDDPFLCYVSGQNTATLVIDAMFCNGITIICRMKRTASSALEPCRDTVSVRWKVPDIDGIPTGLNGAMARESISQMNFTVNYNAHGIGALSDAVIAANFAIAWKKRNSAGSYSFLQWGRNVRLGGTGIRTTNLTSTLLQAETYLLGEYRPVTYNGTVVMYNNRIVYGRVY